ncbi:hypothetical protein BHM03_00045231 [Ensete ventricosum]|nr:hypothetical protein BHM03_00045231 [Ensete ventricosum]
MGHVSASSSDAHTKLTITRRQGLHDPHAWEQSGRLDPATCSVSSFPCALPAVVNLVGDVAGVPLVREEEEDTPEGGWPMLLAVASAGARRPTMARRRRKEEGSMSSSWRQAYGLADL